MTIKDFLLECEVYKYSNEAFQLQKECAELDLLETYVENSKFISENRELFKDSIFTEGLSKWRMDDLAENLLEKSFKVIFDIIMGLDKFIRWFIAAIRKLISLLNKESREVMGLKEKMQTIEFNKEDVDKLISDLESNMKNFTISSILKNDYLRLRVDNSVSIYTKNSLNDLLTAALSTYNIRVKLTNKAIPIDDIHDIIRELLGDKKLSSVKYVSSMLEDAQKDVKNNGFVVQLNVKKLEKEVSKLTELSKDLTEFSNKAKDQYDENEKVNSTQAKDLNQIYRDIIEVLKDTTELYASLIEYRMKSLKTIKAFISKKTNQPMTEGFIPNKKGTGKTKHQVEKIRKDKFFGIFSDLMEEIFDKKKPVENKKVEEEKQPEKEDNSKEIKEKLKVVAERIFEETKTPCVSLNLNGAKKEDPIENRTKTKIGGIPYWPKGKEYPKYKDTELMMVAQLNMEEIPKMEGYPETGIIQIFIYDYYDDYSCMIYHDKIEKEFIDIDEKFTTLNTSDPGRMIEGVLYPDLKLDYEGINYSDDRYYDLFLKHAKEVFEEDWDSYFSIPDEIIDEMYYTYTAFKSFLIGGQPFYIQSDSRGPNQIQLLQLDSDYGMKWGDDGIAHFFCTKDQLSNPKFKTDISFYWDCY